MNKKKVLFISILIILFLGISTISATDTNSNNNSTTITTNTNINSQTTENTNNIQNTENINNNIENTSIQNSNIQNKNTTLAKTITSKNVTKITLNKITASVTDNITLKATIIDDNANTYITNGTIAFKINGKTIGHATISNGKATLTYNTSSLNAKTYTITAVYGESTNYQSSIANNTLSLSLLRTKSTVKTISTYVTNTVTLVATIVDKNNAYVTNGTVVFKINGVTVGKTNVSNGKALLNYNTSNLIAKNYTITAIYGSNSKYNTTTATSTLSLSRLGTKVIVSNINTKTGTSTNINATVKDSLGNLVKTGTVIFKLNNTTIGSATVNNGFASLNYTTANIVKNYVLTATYTANNKYTSSYAKSTVYTTLKVGILYWGSKGNITSNTVLYSNLVKSSITTNIINAAKNGTPYVVLGDGNGPTVFIVAGIHGSELSSQAAAIKLINTLATQEIHGTLYIIPFVAPSMTATNTRYYNGQNLNTVADTSGTISNKVYLLAKSVGATALGDFHCTQPGADPGTNVIFGSYSPMSSSATLAKYIANKTGFSSIIYSKAGTEYPGALEDYCNNHGITSVTCEVVTAHGTIASGSVTKSYTMMNIFLNYYNLL